MGRGWGDKRVPEHAGPLLLAMAKILVFILRTRWKPLNKAKARTQNFYVMVTVGLEH